ncbi:MAG: hypothetical protein LBQ83_05815 [Candidatus Margulisbacteria bacterium]|jgi:hypothetical protein|nr:hypothetical protein [Candidatus Margulisiibacteriota bacterium]
MVKEKIGSKILNNKQASEQRSKNMTIQRGAPMLAEDILRLNFLPVGTILMYDGAGWADDSTIPGWYACNTANAAAGRTPDLTNKFVMGSTARGSTGGSNSFTLTTEHLPAHAHSLSGLTIGDGGAHGHTVTGTVGSNGAHTHTVTGTVASGGGHDHGVTDPGHSHTTPNISNTDDHSGGNLQYLVGDEYNWGAGLSVTSSATGITIDSGGAHGHTFSSGSAASAGGHDHTFSSGSAAGVAAHTHTVSGGTIGNTGSGSAFDNRPSYYTLIYIRKCA